MPYSLKMTYTPPGPPGSFSSVGIEETDPGPGTFTWATTGYVAGMVVSLHGRTFAGRLDKIGAWAAASGVELVNAVANTYLEPYAELRTASGELIATSGPIQWA